MSDQKGKLEELLKTSRMGKTTVHLEQVDSTNTLAKKLADEGLPEGTLVMAEEQTGGRGRLGRSWCTPKGTAVAMTLLLRPKFRPEHASMVTLVMGLAVTKAIRQLCSIHAGIKWPNDVVIGGKKICGILTEMSADQNGIRHLVVGVGINVNVPEFPKELRSIATSLLREVQQEVDREELIAECMFWFEKYYSEFVQQESFAPLKEEYEAFLLNKNQKVKVLEPGNEYTGIALGINDKGELLVQREDGTTTAIYAGEVSVRGIYGYV